MAHLTKIGICFTALFALLAACSDRQDKIGWEPEVAMPLALLTVDLNQKIDMASYTLDIFNIMGVAPGGQAKQNQILYTAITEYLNRSEGDSVKKRLPPDLQADVNKFVRSDPSAPEAAPLLENLFDAFKVNGSITATNSFTYHVLKNLPSEMAWAVDSLCNQGVEMNQNIELDMSTLVEKSDKLRRLQLLLAASTRLRLSAQMQLYLRNSAGDAYDSLFAGREGQMPFTNAVGDELRRRVICDYPTPEAAQQAMSVHTISLVVKSSSLKLDTSLLWLKDLHNRKIHASVGIMFKTNLDDMIEK